MPLLYALRRLLLAQTFILGIALLSLLSPSARPGFPATVCKSNLCILALLVLGWTTPFPELLQALRRLRLPSVMLTTLALMYAIFQCWPRRPTAWNAPAQPHLFPETPHRVGRSRGAILGHLLPHHRPGGAHLPGYVRKGVEVNGGRRAEGGERRREDGGRRTEDGGRGAEDGGQNGGRAEGGSAGAAGVRSRVVYPQGGVALDKVFFPSRYR